MCCGRIPSCLLVVVRVGKFGNMSHPNTKSKCSKQNHSRLLALFSCFLPTKNLIISTLCSATDGKMHKSAKSFFWIEMWGTPVAAADVYCHLFCHAWLRIHNGGPLWRNISVFMQLRNYVSFCVELNCIGILYVWIMKSDLYYCPLM